MLRQLSAALIAASMLVAPALAADTAKAPVAPAQTVAPDGKATSTVEKSHVAKHVRHRHVHTAGRTHHHSHVKYATPAHRKHVRHVAQAKHPGRTAQIHSQQVRSKPAVTGEPTVKPARPAAPPSPNRMN